MPIVKTRKHFSPHPPSTTSVRTHPGEKNLPGCHWGELRSFTLFVTYPNPTTLNVLSMFLCISMHTFAKKILKDPWGLQCWCPSFPGAFLPPPQALLVSLRPGAFWSRNAVDQCLSIWKTQALTTMLHQGSRSPQLFPSQDRQTKLGRAQ